MKKPKKPKQRTRTNPNLPAATVATPPINRANMVWRTLLLWGGIFGGALTLFSNMQSFLDMSHWARFIVEHWTDWMYSFWGYVAYLGGQEPSHETATVMTFICSLMMICFSAIFIGSPETSPSQSNSGPWPWQWSDTYITHWTFALASGMFALLLFNFAIELLVFKNSLASAAQSISWIVWVMVAAVSCAVFFHGIAGNRRLIPPYAALAICISLFYFIIAHNSAEKAFADGPNSLKYYRAVVLEYSYGFFPLQMGSFLTVAEVGYILLRFLFVGAGVLILYMLNLLSASSLSLAPPI